jgi:ribosomal protein L21
MHDFKNYYICTIKMKDTLSSLSSGAYELGVKNKSLNDKVEAANKHSSWTGYRVNAKHSNADITTYQHENNPRNIVIAHRGTDLHAKHGRRDIRSDLALAIGTGGHEDRFKRRQKKTEQILKSLSKENDGIDELHLTGHSLGGSSVNHTIANSKLVQKHLTSAHTYNAGAHPVFSNGTKVSDKDKAILNKKVVHHRIEGDAVSAGLLKNTAFGKVKTHKLKQQKHTKKSNGIFNRIFKLHPLKKIRDLGKKAALERAAH